MFMFSCSAHNCGPYITKAVFISYQNIVYTNDAIRFSYSSEVKICILVLYADIPLKIKYVIAIPVLHIFTLYHFKISDIISRCSAHIVRKFLSTPFQLAARQRKVEKEKETLVGQGRCRYCPAYGSNGNASETKANESERKLPGLRIRIDLMQIRIRIQHYLIADPDTGFDDLK
jgi:hypothetical protein